MSSPSTQALLERIARLGVRTLSLTAWALVSACAGRSGHGSPDPVAGIAAPTALPENRLTAFRSDVELEAYLRELAVRQSTNRVDAVAETVSVMAESVTNVQHEGVDEGGIVKVHGEHLIVLRRGRLFSLEIRSLRQVAVVDAFGPDVDPDRAWYDEMLVSDGRIVVVGYSYERGGTELGLFDIDRGGRIRYRATYHLRSDDYYSSRNYGSRLVGRSLVFYTPLFLQPEEEAPLRDLPALRKWSRGATESGFRPIYSARRIYRPLMEVGDEVALHTVTTCDLAAHELTCRATAVLGPPARVFYVSPNAVYVWVADWASEGPLRRSVLYRMPLSGGDPLAVQVSGSPVDQFSFLERGEHLNVLVRAGADGDGMWRAEVTEGDTALLRLPLASFRHGVHEVGAARYRSLPTPSEEYGFQNRFIGDHLLYGTGSGWVAPVEGATVPLYAYRYADGGAAATLELGHGIDRIEGLGTEAAVVVGADGEDLHLSSIDLASEAVLVDRYTRPQASQGELRSHGFFYKPHDERRGTLGLPIAGPGRPGYEHLFQNSASILFLRNDSLRLREAGELEPRAEAPEDDGCRASCVDWYGNARPLFLRGKVLALLGYEIVEGRLDRGWIQEVRRTSFAPKGPPPGARDH